MTDKVDAIMEDMVPELNHYKNEDYFTEEEIRMIVKERRQTELIISMSPHGKRVCLKVDTSLEALLLYFSNLRTIN